MIYVTTTATNPAGGELAQKVFTDPNEAQTYIKSITDTGGTVKVVFGPGVDDDSTVIPVAL